MKRNIGTHLATFILGGVVTAGLVGLAAVLFLFLSPDNAISRVYTIHTENVRQETQANNDSQGSDTQDTAQEENQATEGESSANIQGSVSLEQAIAIAETDLAQRGIQAEFRNDSGIGIYRTRRVWELEFQSSRGEIEYYINVDNGNVEKFEFW